MKLILVLFLLLTELHADFDFQEAYDGSGIAGGGDLLDVHWTGTTFVASGEGVILSSSDGVSWLDVTPSTVASNATKRWHTVVGDDSLLVILSSDSALVTSDLVTWQVVTLPAGEVFVAADRDATRIVALADSGALFSSVNGVTWSQIGTLPSTEPDTLLYGNGVWMSHSLSEFYRSVDAVSWTTQDQEVAINDPADPGSYLPEGQFLTFDGTHFLCGWVEDVYNSEIGYARSVDGLSWEFVTGLGLTLTADDQGGGSSGVTLGGGLGNYGDGLIHNGAGRLTIVSNDFRTLDDDYTFDGGITFNSCASNSTVTVVVGDEGYVASALGSSGAWEDQSGVFASLTADSDGQTLTAVLAERFRRTDTQGNPRLVRTVDGQSWLPVTHPFTSLVSWSELAWVEGTWFLRSGAEFAKSTDGQSWTTYQSTLTGSGESPFPQLWFDGAFYSYSFGYSIAGGGGYLAKSSDGESWTELTVPTVSLYTLVKGGGELQIFAEDGQYFISGDGGAWQTVANGKTAIFEISSSTFSWPVRFKSRWLDVFPGFASLEHEVSADARSWQSYEPSSSISLDYLSYLAPIGGSGDTLFLNGSFWVGDAVILATSDGLDFGLCALPEGEVQGVYPLGNQFVALFQDASMALTSRTADSSPINLLRPGMVEGQVEPTMEARLLQSSSLTPSSFSPIGDWRAGEDGFLFWQVDEASLPLRAFYQIEYQPQN